MSIKTNIKIVEEWKNLHLIQKKSHTEIALLYNVNRETVRRNLTKIGVKSINYHNEMKHDKDKFSVIETEEDAYWLGFIYADGYVSDNNDFEIGLKESDYLHLEKFIKYLNLNSNVKYNKKQKSCRVIYRNKTLVDNLKNFGVVPRKSLILKFPYDKISDNLIKHFIRGYFDGDGCISIYSNKLGRKIVQVSLLGTNHFLNGIRKFSPIIFPNFIMKNNNERTFILSTAHKKARIFIDWLYKDSTIYLDRKYEKYKIALLNRNI